jgi:hypothetical protein
MNVDGLFVAAPVRGIRLLFGIDLVAAYTLAARQCGASMPRHCHLAQLLGEVST